MNRDDIEKQLNLLERVAEKLKNGLITSGNVAHDGNVQGYTIENVASNIRKILDEKPKNDDLDKEVDRFLVEAWGEFKKDGQLMGKIAEEVSEVAYHFVNWHKEKLISFLVSESNFLHKQCQEDKGDLAKQYRAEIYREIVAKLKDM